MFRGAPDRMIVLLLRRALADMAVASMATA